MTTRNEHRTEDLGAYVLGALDQDEARELAAHLADCAECQAQLDDLTAMKDSLGELPPEAFLEGPPEDGELLLHRTLRRVRQEKNTTLLTRRVVTTAAAVVAVAIALGGGVLLGKNGGSGQTGQAVSTPATIAPTTTTPIAGTHVVSAVQDGVRINAVITPAAGWIKVNASVTGIPAGQKCKIIVVSKSGDQEVAGSWLVSQAGAVNGTNLDGAALIDPSQVAAIQVQNFDGHTFVSANV